MATRRPKKPYYYASGRRVALEPADDLVAVDEARLAQDAPKPAAIDDALSAGTTLPGGIRLVRRDSLGREMLAELERAGAIQPVFRQGGATLVALPEIRVEDESEAKLTRVREFAADRGGAVTGDLAGRLMLRLRSDDGRDALALANELSEHFAPISVSPHFLRVVPRPDPPRPASTPPKPPR